MSERDAAKVAWHSEQVLGQENGFSLLMLLAEINDHEDDEDGHRAGW